MGFLLQLLLHAEGVTEDLDVGGYHSQTWNQNADHEEYQNVDFNFSVKSARKCLEVELVSGPFCEIKLISLFVSDFSLEHHWAV